MNQNKLNYANMKINQINEIAKHEGWGLFFCYGSLDGLLQIQKYDEQTTFKSDVEAIKFVKSLAKLGSYVHNEAIKLSDDTLTKKVN